MAYSFGPRPFINTNGLVLHLDAGNTVSYPGSGSTWTDLSGNGNNVTLINGPTFDSANGGSIVFDGTNDYGVTTSNIQGLSNLTKEVFIKIPTYTTSQKMILDLDVGIRLEISDGYFNSLFGNGSGWIYGYDAATWIRPSFVYSANVYYHVCVTEKSGGFAKMYINGVLNSSLAIGSATTPVRQLFIARFSTGTGFELAANIPIVRLYSRELSASEVTQNFNALKSRFGL